MKIIRHYIYINSNDIYNTNDKIQMSIKNIHKKNCNIEIKYYNYFDIINLLEKYDNELCLLFKKINKNYPALLSDIGRLVILYYYGGIYHDLKFISNNELDDFLKNIKKEVIFIAEEHPIEKERIRNGNIIVLEKYNKLLDIVLKKIKKELMKGIEKKYFGSKKMFYIGSYIYIDEFMKKNNNKYIKLPFFKNKLINYNNSINRKIKNKWQKTNEYIFI